MYSGIFYIPEYETDAELSNSICSVRADADLNRKGEAGMAQKNIYRDMHIGQISEELIGSTIRAAGWVENIRDHGGVSFVDLRDMYGVLQVVMRNTALLKGLSREMCISVSGVMEKRDQDTYNPRIPTGTIELEAHSVDVLGKVYQQLPFEVMTSRRPGRRCA